MDARMPVEGEQRQPPVAGARGSTVNDLAKRFIDINVTRDRGGTLDHTQAHIYERHERRYVKV